MWKGYRPRVRLVLAGGHASAWFSPFCRGSAPGAQRYQAAVNAIQALLDSDVPTAALLVDLSKAFERVNPYWILYILQMRGAPTWVCNYAKYVLLQGRLLLPRAVHLGLDMGRSFSVFLFCLAMDPIYHYLNKIPQVLSVQEYKMIHNYWTWE